MRPDFKKMAQDALGLTGEEEGEHYRIYETNLPAMMAALAEAYGLGRGEASTAAPSIGPLPYCCNQCGGLAESLSLPSHAGTWRCRVCKLVWAAVSR